MADKWKIIYEDEDLVVCDKPAGVAVQSRQLGKQDLEGMVRTHLMRKTGRRDVFAAAVHRLDQPVEGIVLVAGSRAAAAKLSEQMKRQEWEKIYLAVVEGHMEQERGLLCDYLKKDGRQNFSYVADREEEGAREARLEYQVLETVGDRQLLEIHLHTGRHHQIRVQLSHAGHPIVDDGRYNPKCSTSSGRLELALCAARLTMVHPTTQERMTFVKKPQGKNFQEFTYIQKMCTQ